MMVMEHVMDFLAERFLSFMHMNLLGNQHRSGTFLGYSSGLDNLSGGPLGRHLFYDLNLLGDFALNNWRADHLVLDDCFRLLLDNLSPLTLLFDDVLVSLVNDGLVSLMNDLLLTLVNDWLMNLVHQLLVYHRLVMLMNYLLVVLMHHIFVVLVDHVLMVLVDDISVHLFHNGRIHVHFYTRSHCVAVDSDAFHVSLYNGRLFVPDDSSLCERFLHNGGHGSLLCNHVSSRHNWYLLDFNDRYVVDFCDRYCLHACNHLLGCCLLRGYILLLMMMMAHIFVCSYAELLGILCLIVD